MIRDLLARSRDSRLTSIQPITRSAAIARVCRIDLKLESNIPIREYGLHHAIASLVFLATTAADKEATAGEAFDPK